MEIYCVKMLKNPVPQQIYLIPPIKNEPRFQSFETFTSQKKTVTFDLDYWRLFVIDREFNLELIHPGSDQSV